MDPKAIFLDRDGVLNESIVCEGIPYPPRNIAELVIADDVFSALHSLKAMGYWLIVVTNQPDVSRGTCSKSVIETINQVLMDRLPLDEVKVCYHDNADKCSCRKPAPGMLLDAAAEYQLHLEQCVMIGDRWRDIEAGHNAGCKTILLQKIILDEPLRRSPDFIASSLTNAVKWIKEYL
ncbi:MAG: HAD-IIIA family hydrolase [bacterium]|nr:HAD-IIIA family hydrolase [bacterium]